MRILQYLLVSIISILLFSSCNRNIHKIAVTKAMDNVVYLDEKKEALTEVEANTWQHLNLAKDTIPGMDMINAHKFVESKKATPLVVAVIDSGMDIEHEDLKSVIWTNPNEISGNGIDDDQNGFIDDIHGWNFLGTKFDENLEITRMVKMYAPEFEGKSLVDIKEQDKKRYGLYTELKEKVQKQFKKSKSVYFDLGFHKTANSLLSNEYNYDIKIYGNSNVKGADKTEVHGTHVAGIIAANRTNDIGMKGVSNHVKIMAIRVVPNGDEYDKDVAMGIRYAVDNGAKIINMSFGKAYSPNKEWVGEAMKYAADHDVLILHSAGNSGNNIDIDHTYPNDAPDYITDVADNVLTIGALSYKYGKKLIASFSNYGKKSVDIFAPGVKIYSTVPNNKYKHFSGTSMATPATAGVAALVRIYYPELSATQVKHIIMDSGIKINKDVRVPGTKDVMKPFSELSVTGRIVNAYNALIMADKMINR